MFARFIWLRLLVLMVPLAFYSCGGDGGGDGGGAADADAEGDGADDQGTVEDATEDGTVADAVEEAIEDGTVADVTTDTVTPPDTPPDGPPPDGPAPDLPPLADVSGDLEPYFPPCAASPNDCRSAAGATACPPELADDIDCEDVVSVRGVRWDDDLVVIRNRTGGIVDLDGWYLVHLGQSFALPDVEMQILGKLYIHTSEDAPGTPEDNHIYLGAGAIDLHNIDEIAIFDNDQFDSPDHIRGFASWGFVPGAGSRIGVAVAAELWPAVDGFIEVCEDAVGIVPVGCVCDPGSYHSNPGDSVCSFEWGNL